VHVHVHVHVHANASRLGFLRVPPHVDLATLTFVDMDASKGSSINNVAYCDYSVKPTASSRPGPAEAAATEMAGAAGASVPMPASAAPEAPAAPAAVVESAAA